MRAHFAYGKTGIDLDLPDHFHYKTLEARSAAPLPDQTGAIAAALDAPIAGPPLTALASAKKSAAISVCDITRPAPNKLVLPPLLKRLHAAGIARENVTILIATGLHRLATPAELDEILSPEIAASYRIVNHNARQLSDHRYLGETKAGTPVYVAEDFVAADLHITLGFIEPHLMAGFSGARKLVAPGLAAQETIKVLHSPKFMRDARAVEGSIEGNPLHRELLEIAQMAGHHFMVDVTLTRDRQIAGVFAGEPVQAHRAGMDFVSKVMLEQLPTPVDGVITSCAGYPLDLTFYQAIKGITAAQHIVKPGGRILLIAECKEGPGAREFCELLKKTNSGAHFLDLIQDTPVEVDQWQLEKLALVTRKAEIFFFTPGLPGEFHKTVWGTVFSTKEEAIRAFSAGLPPSATVALVPEGPYVLAKAA